jgi:serine/threonine protein kinase
MTDYQEAVQVPSAAFSGPELKQGVPVMNKLGLPRPICGQFASVYELEHGGSRWAVKCFLRNIPDLHSRYAKISNHLSECDLPYFVTFEYQQKGIRVRGNHYPLVKMEWVEGLGLNQFLEQNLTNQTVLAALEQDWLTLLEDLQPVRIAHCDLQHGNVLVTDDGSLRLIDYDGMWVPKLKGQKSNEVGHPDYQSPLRTEKDFNADIDGFAGDVIHVAIRALAAWDKYNNGDNILFRRQDFLDPRKSALFAEIRSLGDQEINGKLDDLTRACGGKVKRGGPSRFFKPKKAKAPREATASPEPRQAKPAAPVPAAAPAQTPKPPPTPAPLAGGLAPSPKKMVTPPPKSAPKPKPKPAPAPRPAAAPPAPKGPGSWLADHVGGGAAAPKSAPAKPKGASILKPARILKSAAKMMPAAKPPPAPTPAPAAQPRPATRPIPQPSPAAAFHGRQPYGKRVLGFTRLLINFLLVGPVLIATVLHLQELSAGFAERATAILASGFGLALLLGILSIVSIYVARKTHRVVSVLFFGLTAVLMLLTIFSELLTAGWSDWTGDEPVQCVVILAMLVLSGLGLTVEHFCHRLGVVTQWRRPWSN